MRRREDFAIRRHTLNLYEGDFERLQAIHGTRIGASKIIRDLVRSYLRKIDTATAEGLRAQKEVYEETAQ